MRERGRAGGMWHTLAQEKGADYLPSPALPWYCICHPNPADEKCPRVSDENHVFNVSTCHPSLHVSLAVIPSPVCHCTETMTDFDDFALFRSCGTDSVLCIIKQGGLLENEQNTNFHELTTDSVHTHTHNS